MNKQKIPVPALSKFFQELGPWKIISKINRLTTHFCCSRLTIRQLVTEHKVEGKCHVPLLNEFWIRRISHKRYMFKTD